MERQIFLRVGEAASLRRHLEGCSGIFITRPPPQYCVALLRVIVSIQRSLGYQPKNLMSMCIYLAAGEKIQKLYFSFSFVLC